MKIYLAADHAGFDLKEEIRSYLLSKNWEVEDLGNFKKVQDDDYPDWGALPAEKRSNDEHSRGIVFGWAGEGQAIFANDCKNLRAVVVFYIHRVTIIERDVVASIRVPGS